MLLLLQTVQHLTGAVISHAPLLHAGGQELVHALAPAAPPAPPPAPKPTGQGDLADLNNLLQATRNAIFYIGVTVFLIGVTVAGIMRMTAFGSERRIAMSNMALTAAVAGLVIILLANGLYNFIANAFPPGH